MARHEKLAKAVTIIRTAVDVRRQITDLYAQYNALCGAVTLASAGEAGNGVVKRPDLKRAVDALYYLGGGWPSPTSKGRMEALLDNFVGMYRVLDFIGEGSKVTEHLRKLGVTVALDPEFKLRNFELTPNDRKALNAEYRLAVLLGDDPTDFYELVSFVVMACQDLQSEICGLADQIKDDLRPAAMRTAEIQDEEYNRLHKLVQLRVKDTARTEDRVRAVRGTIDSSISNFNLAVQFTKEPT